MAEDTLIFYYSRRKLGAYLLFNLGLLALAVLFTWSIFPDYKPIYYFALVTCSLSIASALAVFLIRMPLAVADKEAIKLDHNQPLKWAQIKTVATVESRCCGLERRFLRIEPRNIAGYKMSLMQKLVSDSRYGAFSVPLYAMEPEDAEKIEKLIRRHVAKPAINKTAVRKIAGGKMIRKVAPVKKTSKTTQNVKKGRRIKKLPTEKAAK